MDILEAIKNRRSVRSYSDRPIPDEVLERMRRALRSAPSACNLQPWRFIFVSDAEMRQKLARAANDQLFMADDATIGYAPSRIFGTPTTMLWVYRLGLEHAKQFLLTGEAIDAQTALRIGLVSRVVPAADLAQEVEAHARRFRHIPANQLALNKLLINQAYENMGLRTTQLLGTLFDGVTRHTEEAYRWAESFREKGFRQVIRERDAPWGDYGERKKR